MWKWPHKLTGWDTLFQAVVLMLGCLYVIWHIVLLSPAQRPLTSGAADFVAKNNGERGPDSVLAQSPRDETCKRVGFKIYTGDQTQLTDGKRCAFVVAAYRVLAASRADRTRPPSSDTSAVAAATVTHFEFRNLETGDATSYWSIDFELPKRPYDVQVQFDGLTGAAAIVRTHK